MKKLILIICTILLFTGCGKVEQKNNTITLKDENQYVYIESNDDNVTSNTKVEIGNINKDFTELDANFEKAIGYEIDLKNSNEKVELSSKVKVGILIPEDFSNENLKVYYLENNKISEEFAVEVKEIENQRYAVFETNHFSTYILVQIKQKLENKEEQETIKEEEKEENTPNNSTETNKNTNTSNQTTNNNQKPNNNTNSNNNTNTNQNTKPETQTTINLVGMWQTASDRFYKFNSDGTGMEAIYLDRWTNIDFTWSYQNGNLTINQAGRTYNNKLIIYNNDKFTNSTSVFNRYYGDWPSNKDEFGNITEGKKIVFELINIPEGLKVTKQATTSVYIEVTGPSDVIKNGSFRGVIDLSNAVEGDNPVHINYIFPEGVTYQTYTTGNLITLEKE